MKSKGRDCRLITIQKPPPGRYEGTWSGYRAAFSYGSNEYGVTVDSGLRGASPCWVVVSESGEITVEEKNA